MKPPEPDELEILERRLNNLCAFKTRTINCFYCCFKRTSFKYFLNFTKYFWTTMLIE